MISTVRMLLAVPLLSLLMPVAGAQTRDAHDPLAVSSLRVVAIRDSPAVGVSGAFYLQFFSPTINAQGRVLFGGRMYGDGIDWMTDDGLWVERNDTTIELVAAEGMQATDAPAGTTYRGENSYFSPFYSGIAQPVINENGLVNFFSRIEGAAVGTANGLWYFDQYGRALLGYLGQPVSQFGQTRIFGSLNTGVRMNATGTTLTSVQLLDPQVGVFMRTSLGGGFEILDSVGVPVSDFPQDYYSAGSYEPVLNDAGMYACVRGINWFNYYRGPAIYSNRTGSFASVYSYLTEVPGGVPADSFTYFGQLMMNRNGSIGFYAMTTQEGSNGKSGLWAESGGSLHNVMLNRSQAPGTPAGILFNNLTPGGNYPNDVYYTNDEQVIFVAYLTGSGVTLSNDAGVWRWNNGSLDIVTREGEQVPGETPGVIFVRIDRLIVNQVGDIVLQAQVSGPGYSTANDEGLWVLDPFGHFKPVVLEGDRIPVGPGGYRTIDQISLANGYYGLPSTGADGRGTILTSGRKIVFQTRLHDNGILAEAVVVADLNRLLTKKLPVLVKQKRPGQPDVPVANSIVNIGRFDPSDPFNLLGFTQDTTDSEGFLILDSTTFAPGDSFLLLCKAYSHPSPKPGHEAVGNIVYDLILDNLIPAPSGMLRPDTLRGAYDDTTTTYLDHATVKHNLIVSVEWPAERSYIDSLIRAFGNAGEYLYDISNGQAYLGNIDIFDNGRHWSDADIRIHASNKQWPMANVFGVRNPGEFMCFPPVWFGGERATRLGVFNEQPLNPNSEMNFRTLVHELGHLAFGFYDEYIDANNTPLPAGTTYGFMDSQYRDDNDPFTSEMSASHTVAGYQSTAQWQKNRKTCWDFFRDVFDTTVNGLRVHFSVPTEVGFPSGLSWIPGPNDIPGSPDIKVSKATFVYGTATGSSVPEFRPRFTYAGGKPMADADISMQKTSGWRIISLGGATDNGRIRTLGADAGDTVIANGRFGGRFYEGKLAVPQPGMKPGQISSDELVVFPIAGTYNMISGASFDAGGLLRFTATSSAPYPNKPNFELRNAGSPPISFQLAGDSLLHTTVLPDTLSGDYSAIFAAPDSSGVPFRVLDHLSIRTLDSTSRLVVSGRSGVMLYLDSSARGLDRIAIFSSSFPPPTTGLGDSLMQLTNVIAISGRPASVPVRGMLAVSYADLFDSLALRSVENVQLYRWSGSWQPLVTVLDTARNTAACTIEESGTYAAFLTPTVSGIEGKDEGGLLPDEYRLEQNFPNPFNPSTRIRFVLPGRDRVTLRVFDLLGRELVLLVNETREAGSHSVVWNAADYPSGVYFYELRAGSFTQRKKLLLIR